MKTGNNAPYPPEEDAIAAAIVRELARSTCWDHKINAWLALMQIRQQAEDMREERNRFSTQPQGG